MDDCNVTIGADFHLQGTPSIGPLPYISLGGISLMIICVARCSCWRFRGESSPSVSTAHRRCDAITRAVKGKSWQRDVAEFSICIVADELTIEINECIGVAECGSAPTAPTICVRSL